MGEAQARLVLSKGQRSRVGGQRGRGGCRDQSNDNIPLWSEPPGPLDVALADRGGPHCYRWSSTDTWRLLAERHRVRISLATCTVCVYMTS